MSDSNTWHVGAGARTLHENEIANLQSALRQRDRELDAAKDVIDTLREQNRSLCDQITKQASSTTRPSADQLMLLEVIRNHLDPAGEAKDRPVAELAAHARIQLKDLRCALKEYQDACNAAFQDTPQRKAILSGYVPHGGSMAVAVMRLAEDYQEQRRTLDVLRENLSDASTHIEMLKAEILLRRVEEKPEARTKTNYAYYFANLTFPVEFIIEESSAKVQRKIDELLKRAGEGITAARIHSGLHLHRKAGHDVKWVQTRITMVLE